MEWFVTGWGGLEHDGGILEHDGVVLEWEWGPGVTCVQGVNV